MSASRSALSERISAVSESMCPECKRVGDEQTDTAADILPSRRHLERDMRERVLLIVAAVLVMTSSGLSAQRPLAEGARVRVHVEGDERVIGTVVHVTPDTL